MEHVLKGFLAPVVLLQQRHFGGKDLGPRLAGGVSAHHRLHASTAAPMGRRHLIPERGCLVDVCLLYTSDAADE